MNTLLNHFFFTFALTAIVVVPNDHAQNYSSVLFIYRSISMEIRRLGFSFSV